MKTLTETIRKMGLQEQDPALDPQNDGEYNDEGGMAITQLKTARDAVDELMTIIKDDDNLPEWVQSKLTKAVDYMDSVRDYLSAEFKEAIDPADVDDDATADDVKNAAKNIIVQLRKASDVKGNKAITFADGKSKKIKPDVIDKLLKIFMQIKKPRDKEKFQAMIAKSERDMMNIAKKLGAQYNAEELDEAYQKSQGFNNVDNAINLLSQMLDPRGALAKNISKGADNVSGEFKKMQRAMQEIEKQWNEVNMIIGQNESVNEDYYTVVYYDEKGRADGEKNFKDKKKADAMAAKGNSVNKLGGKSGYKVFKVKGKMEEIDMNEAMDQKAFASAEKELVKYATKSGGIDKKDFMDVAKMLGQIGRVNILQAGQVLTQLNRKLKGMDTDPRDKVYEILKSKGLMEEVEMEENFSPKEIKMAIGVASDKRYAGGNMTGAVKAIEKIKKGLSKHKQVAAVLQRQNEDVDYDQMFEEAFMDLDDTIRSIVLGEAQSGDKEAYQKFFKAAMKKFGIKSPGELSGDKEKEFYDYIDKNWKGDNEKAESAEDGAGDHAEVGKSGKKMKVKVDPEIEEAVEIVAEDYDISDLTEEQLDELIGKIAKGLGKVAKKAGSAAVSGVKKAANRMSTSGRADAADKKAASLEKKKADRERLQRAKERLQKAKDNLNNSFFKEAEMTDAQMKKREEIVKELKKKEADFKERYGDRAKEVMYATATKMAMKS